MTTNKLAIIGGSWLYDFEEFKDCGYSDLWFKERDKMLSTKK